MDLDLVLVVIDPTAASIDVALRIDRAVRNRPGREGMAGGSVQTGGRQGAALPILNRVTSPRAERELRAALKARGVDPIGALREDSSISMAWLQGAALRGTVARADAERVATMLERLGRTR